MAELVIPMTVAGRQHVAENDDAMRELVGCARSFEYFLKYWYFIPEGGAKTCMGESMWPAQRVFAEKTARERWIFFLKARQLGESTVECAYDGWRLRFGPPNSRVHIMSRTETEAKGLLADVKYGLSNLPWWMVLPVGEKETEVEVQFGSDPDDVRVVHAYATSSSPGRGETCTHAHVDEWADMLNPMKVWSAVEPSVAEGGTCHVVTTGQGPSNFSSAYWRKCISGDGKLAPCFIDALQRPGRDPAWYEKAKRAHPDEGEFLREYPMTWEDAISGGGEYVFRSREIDAAGQDFRPLGEPRKGRRYAKGADIGRHQDAFVLVVLDVTEDVHDVAHYERHRGIPYPEIQKRIEHVHRLYRGPLGVEKNSAGEAVLENLDIPEDEIDDAKFTTSKASKARIIQQLKQAFQNQTLKFDPDALTQLDVELRGYQTPDDNVVQDSVMALAIAEEYASRAYQSGRLLGSFNA